MITTDRTPTAPEVLVEDRDPISYLYTSGTTSFPKGVVGSHLAIYLESMSAALDSGWGADDSFVAMLPLFHTAQLNAFGTPSILVGATIHLGRPRGAAGRAARTAGRLDGYKIPKDVIVVPEFPRTSTGKVQKNVLRDRFADHYGR